MILHRGADTDGIDELLIPNEIEALIADRIARLPQQLQTLLRSCAVVGAEFSPDLLAGVMGGRADIILQQLSRLQTEHLLDSRRDQTGGTPRLTFRHALLRDVAYKTLLPSRRRGLHARVVELLEPSIETAPQQLDEICHHAVRAQLWRPALRFLQHAAIAAAERTAHATAERHLRKALEIAQSLPPDHQTRATAVDIMIGLRTLLALELRYEEADQLLDQAQKIAEDQAAGALGPDIRLSILVKRVHVLNSLGRVREATAVATEAHRLPVSIGNLALRRRQRTFSGRRLLCRAIPQGEAVLSETIALLPGYVGFRQRPVRQLAGADPRDAGGIRGFLGRFDDAESDCRQLWRSRPRNIALTISLSLICRPAWCAYNAVRWPMPKATFRSGLELAERHGLKALLPSLKAGLGHSLLLAGSTNAAIDALSDAHETAKGRGRLLIHMWAAIGLAAAYGCTGGQVPALRHAEEAVQIGARHTLRGYLVAALRCKGVLLAMKRRYACRRDTPHSKGVGLGPETGNRAGYCRLPRRASCGVGQPPPRSGTGGAQAIRRARHERVGGYVLSADPPAVAASDRLSRAPGGTI